MFNINTELTAECIKSLADNSRCITCDKLNTPCVRYPCGHAVCEECVCEAECCLLCITPPPTVTHYRDEPLSRRVGNVSQLLLAYQELFGEDVEKRVSISKQQKLEKLLFPECIQASNKYFNKRKSSTSISRGKENIKGNIRLPGETVTNKSFKMENKNSYVQQWLNNIQSPENSKTPQRKPFADLNVNTNIQNTGTKLEPRQTRTQGKRNHFKTISKNMENAVPVKKYKKEHSFNMRLKQKSSITTNLKKCEADESGIGMDDDVIEILDSQEVVDKDKLACKAVEEADFNNDDVCMNLSDSTHIEQAAKVCMTPNKSTKTYKVPFHKKSFLYPTHNDHRSCCTTQKNTKLRNVSITIENKSFLTTINVLSSTENDKNIVAESKSSCNIDSINLAEPINKTESETPQVINNLNVKGSSNENINNLNIECNKNNDNLRKGVTINDSDSDSILSSVDKDKEVAVEVHRSCNELDYSVLSEVDLNQSENRARHARREKTPLSTDSSDKENYDPNRMKRMKHDKKCYQKKH